MKKSQLNKILKPLKGIRVENMLSEKGNYIPNQYKIYTPAGVVFQSYSTIIAIKPYGDTPIILNKHHWDYSVTTGKYRNIFLREGIAETRKKIESGEYILADLN
jgi:hypothetical protein